MKKIDLVHTTILIVGVLVGYMAIQAFITLLSALALYGFRESEQITYFFVLSFGPAIISIVLIRNGRRLSELMLRTDPDTSSEEASYWDLDRRNILFVLFIGIGLYTLVQVIPGLLVVMYEFFRSKVSSSFFKPKGADMDSLVITFLKLTLGAFLIYASPTLTNFIERTIAVRLDIKANKPEE